MDNKTKQEVMSETWNLELIGQKPMFQAGFDV